MNKQIAFGRMAIFTIPTLPINEHKISFNRYRENVPHMKIVKSKRQAGEQVMRETDSE